MKTNMTEHEYKEYIEALQEQLRIAWEEIDYLKNRIREIKNDK